MIDRPGHRQIVYAAQNGPHHVLNRQPAVVADLRVGLYVSVTIPQNRYAHSVPFMKNRTSFTACHL